MLRYAILVLVSLLFPQAGWAQASCGADASEAHIAINQARQNIEDGDSVMAVTLAKEAVDLAADCFEAQLVLLEAYFNRFDHVSGLAALPVSRGFRKQMKSVRTMQPDHIPARRMEIQYLHTAPGIVGGSRKKARRLLDELTQLDPDEASFLRIEILANDAIAGRANAKDIELALARYSIRSLSELEKRMLLVRRLVLNEQAYKLADRELASWDVLTLPKEVTIERLLLRGALRVLGGFEYEKADAYLTEFVARRPSLTPDAMEPISTAQAYLGDARRLSGDSEGARLAYKAALAANPDATRASRGLAALDKECSSHNAVRPTSCP